MKKPLYELNAYSWNVGNDIADIRLLAEGALALFEGDAEPLHRLGMKNNEEVASSAFDTIGTALYDLRERIAAIALAGQHTVKPKTRTSRRNWSLAGNWQSTAPPRLEESPLRKANCCVSINLFSPKAHLDN